MPQIRFDDFVALGEYVQRDYGGWGPRVEVSQAMIDCFADLTGDHQWIHVDVERARNEGPYGGTIAHGFLTLSLLPQLDPAELQIAGYTSATNYGAKNLRFFAPVLAGSFIHARSRLLAAQPHAKGSLLVFASVVHAVGNEKPALLYEAQVLYRA
jgi:acyl dehydratase